MAGDWIKFEISTHEKPEVWAIAERLDIDPDAVVGKLLRVWSWFDQHTETGNAPTVTKKLLDRHVCVNGFCEAVIECGWMNDDGESISLPNFDRHNGKTAKTRASTAKRVAAHKAKERNSNGEGNETGNASSVTEALPKEEKRREEKNKENTPQTPQGGLTGFDEFWTAYPKKQGKGAAEKAWKKIKPGKALTDLIVKAVGRQKLSDQWQRGFIPNPATWLNEKRWEDEVETPQGQSPVRVDPLASIRSEYQELHSRIKADERLGIHASSETKARLHELQRQLNPGNGGLQ